MQHDWGKYFDTESDYWEKIQKIYKENDNFPKVVVSGRNLHHKFLRTFSRLEGAEIDNDKENLVSLSEGDHFLVHYYLWKCTKTGYRSRTALPVRFMYKKAAKCLTDEIAELIAKEWKCRGYGCKGWKWSDESKEKLSKSKKGMSTWNKGKKLSEEHKSNIGKANKGKKLRPHSEEHRAKLSAAMKGKNKGKHLSEEQKKELSEAKKGKHWKLVDGHRVWY